MKALDNHELSHYDDKYWAPFSRLRLEVATMYKHADAKTLNDEIKIIYFVSTILLIKFGPK